ncbi:hypothetical protein BDV19DRAFT_234060 [Aspergillus venezuelensis]
MSDDEQYYDEFDDDDIFWVEEADPTEADDLAALANHDPMFTEDPSIETAEFFSDWEDLSDDYYDEDPTAVRRLRAMGLLPLRDESHFADAAPSKRRKTAPTLPTDLATYEGVAWKQPSDKPDLVEIYAPGEGERVSFLKNWREVFRNAKPAIGPLRGRPLSARASGAVSSREQSESDMDVPSLMEDICEDEIVSSDAADSQPVKPLVTAPLQVVMNPSARKPAHPKKGEAELLDDSLDPINGEGNVTTDGEITEPPSKQAKEPPAPAPRRGRKRKASVSIDHKSDASDKTAGAETQPKAKRAAPTKKAQNTKTPSSSAPVRRSARTNK